MMSDKKHGTKQLIIDVTEHEKELITKLFGTPSEKITLGQINDLRLGKYKSELKEKGLDIFTNLGFSDEIEK